MAERRHRIVVTHRLPVRAEPNLDVDKDAHPLKLHRGDPSPLVFVGTLPESIPVSDDPAVHLLESFSCIPVFLDDDLHENFEADLNNANKQLQLFSGRVLDLLNTDEDDVFIHDARLHLWKLPDPSMLCHKSPHADRVLELLNTDKQWKETSCLAADLDWKKTARLMQLYIEVTDGHSQKNSHRWRPINSCSSRTVGSYMEHKESAIVWHHQEADPDLGSWHGKELLDHIENVLANEPEVVKRGPHIVEINPQAAAVHLLRLRRRPQPTSSDSAGGAPREDVHRRRRRLLRANASTAPSSTTNMAEDLGLGHDFNPHNCHTAWHALLAACHPPGSTGLSSRGSTTANVQFLLDSGASMHVVGNARLLRGLRPLPQNAGRSTTLPDGSRLRIIGIGDIQMNGFRIPDVYLVEGLTVNLVSVGRLTTNHGICCCFYGNRCWLITVADGSMVGEAVLEGNGVYGLRFLRVPDAPAEQ